MSSERMGTDRGWFCRITASDEAFAQGRDHVMAHFWQEAAALARDLEKEAERREKARDNA